MSALLRKRRWAIRCDPSLRSTGRLMHRGKEMSLFDHFVGARLQGHGHGQAERLGGLQVDDQLELGRLHDWHLRRAHALKDLTDVVAGLSIHPADARAIAQEPTHRCELPYETYDRELVPVGERDDLLASIQRYRISGGDDRVGLGVQQLLECTV